MSIECEGGANGAGNEVVSRVPRRFRLQAGDTVIEIDWLPGESAAPVSVTANGTAVLREAPAPAAISSASPAAHTASHAASSAATVIASVAACPATPAGGPAAVPEAAALFVRAPMVGTFYHSPDAGARPFVGVGDIVRPGQTIGILEVMKMMNPITAEVTGRVVDMVAGDAEPVEYDQPLIALEPVGSG
ncbi:acetyl-CoA carboxylase biotin carboxyl carrier protein [Streptodolium elevatio]|uniref:Biotin carboxyl carrier protein of acetyl-CoA carboxylase n=1 Tax=Streptodolium elevatio TaxID=3157996 RepID=A0ABV3DFQ2_9ACTN